MKLFFNSKLILLTLLVLIILIFLGLMKWWFPKSLVGTCYQFNHGGYELWVRVVGKLSDTQYLTESRGKEDGARFFPSGEISKEILQDENYYTPVDCKLLSPNLPSE